MLIDSFIKFSINIVLIVVSIVKIRLLRLTVLNYVKIIELIKSRGGEIIIMVFQFIKLFRQS